MTELIRPMCVEFDERGNDCRWFCQVCGVMISEQRGNTTWRSRLYTEIKIQFSDQHTHVTNMCRNCLQRVHNDSVALLQMFEADMWHMAVDVPAMLDYIGKDRGPAWIVAVDTKGRGIP